jgi:hypothetical protein
VKPMNNTKITIKKGESKMVIDNEGVYIKADKITIEPKMN